MAAFSSGIYKARRQELRERMKAESGLVLFVGNTESPAQYGGSCYKWRQDSSWLYFFGVDEPRFAAIMDLDSGVDTVFADDADLDDIIWTGPVPSVAERALEGGVENTAPYAEFSSRAAAAAKSGRKLHFLPASRLYTANLLAGVVGAAPEDFFSRGKSGCSLASAPLVNAVIAMRLIKRPEELEELDRIAEIGYEMHTVARRNIALGRLEQDIVSAMDEYAYRKGWGTSFPSILTQHGEIFHCSSHANPVVAGKLLVVDAGAESDSHYASDHTRTYPTGGVFMPLQRDIYSIVYGCNELAFSLARPGVSYYDVNVAVCRHMLEGLAGAGFVCGDIDALMEIGAAGLFLPHGLGHNIGLDCHDMEDYGEDLVGYGPGQTRSRHLGLGSLRMARVLEEGNVMSDEPGIYFIPELISRWKNGGKGKGLINYSKLEECFGFGGIRIEDDLVVTSDGVRRTGSRRLPAAPDDVENAMKEDQYGNA